MSIMIYLLFIDEGMAFILLGIIFLLMVGLVYLLKSVIEKPKGAINKKEFKGLESRMQTLPDEFFERDNFTHKSEMEPKLPKITRIEDINDQIIMLMIVARTINNSLTRLSILGLESTETFNDLLFKERELNTAIRTLKQMDIKEKLSHQTLTQVLRHAHAFIEGIDADIYNPNKDYQIYPDNHPNSKLLKEFAEQDPILKRYLSIRIHHREKMDRIKEEMKSTIEPSEKEENDKW